MIRPRKKLNKVAPQAFANKAVDFSEEVKALKSIMQVGYGTIDFLTKELTKLEPTMEEIKSTERNERLDAIRYLGNCMAIVNNVIHAGHKLSLNMWSEENIPFIENCMARQKAAREAKAFGACECCVDEVAVEVVSNEKPSEQAAV